MRHPNQKTMFKNTPIEPTATANNTCDTQATMLKGTSRETTATVEPTATANNTGPKVYTHHGPTATMEPPATAKNTGPKRKTMLKHTAIDHTATVEPTTTANNIKGLCRNILLSNTQRPPATDIARSYIKLKKIWKHCEKS